MSLEWRDVTLSSVAPLADAVSTLTSGAQLVQGGLTAANAALSAVQLASLAAAYNDALGAVATQVLGAFADILQGPGVYPLLIYPRRVDYNRALIGERLEAQRAVADTQRTALTRLAQARPQGELEARQAAAARARAESALRAAEVEIARLNRQWHLARSDLLTAFSFTDWLAQFDRSLTDAGDLSRPLFSTSSVVTGVAVVVQTDTLADFPPLLASLAAWARDKRLQREAETLTRLSASSFATATAQTPPEPPDWQAWSLARAIGLEEQIAFLRRGANAFTLPTVGRSSAATRALRTVALMKAAMQESIDVGTQLLQTISALQGLAGTKGSVLVVPPTQGERMVQLSTGPTAVPIYTLGIDGFSAALRAAVNAPTRRWCAGVVMLAGVPIAGLSGTATVDQIALSPGVQAARGQAELAYRFLRGAW